MCSRRSNTAKLLFAILVGWQCLGCGDTDGRFALSGNVTYDGQPVDNGNIGFIPIESSTGKSAGADVVAGKYEIPRYDGPPSGSYKVVIYAERPSGRKIQADEGSTEMIDELVQFIPRIYNSQSTLTVDISGNRDDLNFELKKPKQKTRKRR